MRIALIDHAYHEKTLSSAFFKQAILAGHEVEEWWDARWITGELPDVAQIAARNYDLIIVWQSEQTLMELMAAGVRDMVFVPMWDSCWEISDSWWQALRGIRVVSFCHALHERVRQNGVRSMYVKFFPDPEQFAPVGSFTTLRGFLWQRRPQVSWREMSQLIGDTKFSRLHLHRVPDPGCQIDAYPTDADLARHNMTMSDWFPKREDFFSLLAEFNVFFASRPSEGIGFSFLEAFTHGMCVVAIDNPTMNEYITDRVSGLLWKFGDPRALDFSQAAEMGRRAREIAVRGRDRWLASIPELIRFVFTPTERLAPTVGDYTRFRGGATDSIIQRGLDRRAITTAGAAASVPHVKTQGGLRLQGFVKRDGGTKPLVTVATVTLNCRDVLEGTLHNILNQDYPNLEIVMVDGESTDGTLDIIKQHDSLIDCWISRKDKGPYFAMNQAAELANGQYILFMNAGDWFMGTDALSRAMADAPADADFIIGHHVYRRLDGVEELHKAADFELTWRRLCSGDLDDRWLGGIPGHQATLTRTALLREHRYDTRYAISADHEFMYRQRQRGARFYHTDEILAVYVSGGMSWNNQLRCVEEWWDIAARHGSSEAATRFFLPMKSNLLTRQIKAKPAGRMNYVGRLATARRLRRDAAELRRSGLFSEQWYLDANPDVSRMGMDPIMHYLKFGADELRNPSPFFDTKFYFSLYGDVRQAGKNPLLHYVRHGAAEGRTPNAWLDLKRHLPSGAATGLEPPLLTFVRSMARASSDEAVRIWLGRMGDDKS